MPVEQTLVDALQLITATETLRPEGLSKKEMEELRSLQGVAAGANVVGLGVAEKITAGRQLGVLSLKFYVEKKLLRERLVAGEMVPEFISLPGFGEPLPTDVEEIGRQSLESYTTRVRPLTPGFSICETRSLTGTLGCVVRDRNNPEDLYLLSNAHVLANSGLAEPGATVIQPGLDDGGGVTNDAVAALAAFVPFDFGPGYINLCDAAIAGPVARHLLTSRIAQIGAPTDVSTELFRGMQVQKTGRTTAHTVGLIKDIHYMTKLRYPKPGGDEGEVGFKEQVLCERYTAGGDSGALVCDMRGRAVGLHWAGSASTSAFHRIGHVLDALSVEIVTGEID